MKLRYPIIVLLLVLATLPFISHSNASANPSAVAPTSPPPQMHPSRAIDTAGFFFAHDLRTEGGGATTLVTTVGTSTVITPDGTKIAGGDIRVMEYQITTNDAGKFLDNLAKYDALVAKMFQDSVVDLQFRSQLAVYRSRAIDVSAFQAAKAARILAGKNAPDPVP